MLITSLSIALALAAVLSAAALGLRVFLEQQRRLRALEAELAEANERAEALEWQRAQLVDLTLQIRELYRAILSRPPPEEPQRCIEDIDAAFVQRGEQTADARRQLERAAGRLSEAQEEGADLRSRVEALQEVNDDLSELHDSLESAWRRLQAASLERDRLAVERQELERERDRLMQAEERLANSQISDERDSQWLDRLDRWR